MMFYGHGMGLGWSLMLFAVLLPVLLIAGAFLVTLLRQPPETARKAPDPEQILADRLARGEIAPEEYETRLRALRAAHR